MGDMVNNRRSAGAILEGSLEPDEDMGVLMTATVGEEAEEGAWPVVAGS